MESIKWLAIFNIILVFFISESTAIDKDDCKCDFDSASYIADCDCGLSCSIAMKSGRECHITCDGYVKNISSGYKKVFGEPTEYREQLHSYFNLLSKEGFRTFQGKPFSIKSIMYFFRSAYIGVSFIPENTKIAIDQFVYDSFTINEDQIQTAIFNTSESGFNKKFQNGEQLRVSYKGINLGINEYTIRFRILR